VNAEAKQQTRGMTPSAIAGGPCLDGIQVVTLADSQYLRRSYVAICVRSWARIRGADRPFWLLDAGLGDDDEVIDALGLRKPPEAERRIQERLAPWPALRSIRSRFITWRKLIDAVVLFEQARHVLFIDTDAYVAKPIAFPQSKFDFAYQCDDVPAYRGRWYLPLCEPMLLSLNAGFMLFAPARVDLEELERITSRYFLNAKNMWWTVQAAWSVVMAASGACAMFDGRDVRTFSGNRKRTLTEIQRNSVKLTGRSEVIGSEAEASALLNGAAVLHFAGHGKAWINVAESLSDSAAVTQVLRLQPPQLASALERMMIAGRMLAVQVLK
jgi:hypothetical protein